MTTGGADQREYLRPILSIQKSTSFLRKSPRGKINKAVALPGFYSSVSRVKLVKACKHGKRYSAKERLHDSVLSVT